MTWDFVWVLVDGDDIIRAASVDDGTPRSRAFLEPVEPGFEILRVAAPVTMFDRVHRGVTPPALQRASWSRS